MKWGALAIAVVAPALLGLISLPELLAEERFALSDDEFDSTQRVSFDDISVYPDQVVIAHQGIKYAKVSSNSMAPLITDKSIVFEVAPTSPADIHVGDVISFYEPSVDGVVLHLVVEITAEGYVTKGIANDYIDPWVVSYENVKGIMVGTFR